jgi:hypothetical protein
MIEPIRDLGPIALIPAAWTATALTVLGHLGEEGMLIAHGVMAVFIAFFAVTGWSEMSTGALRSWRTVLVAGLPVTLAGIAGFLVTTVETPLHAVSLIGWMVLPAVGLADTARRLPEAKLVYLSAAGLSILGALAAVAGLALDDQRFVLGALALVAVGQTASIVDASLRDRFSG